MFGVTSEAAEKTLREVYAALLGAGTPHLATDLPTAEMVKVAANSFSPHGDLVHQRDGRGV